MRVRHTAIVGAAHIAVIALVAAGCGDSSDSSTTAATPTSTTSTSTAAGGGKSGGAVTIDVADNPDLGGILTDADGNTVYLFEKDEDGESYCSGECAAAWPPVTTSGDVKAGSGADQSLIGTFTRDDGAEQVTYDGHPLYLYQGDEKPGDTNGNDLDQFGAEWYALTPDGSNAEDASDESDDESDDGSGEDSTSTDSSTTGSVY